MPMNAFLHHSPAFQKPKQVLKIEARVLSWSPTEASKLLTVDSDGVLAVWSANESLPLATRDRVHKGVWFT